MLAISLRNPWAHAVAHLDKRVENRKWSPPVALLGELVAIHATGRPDPRSFALMRSSTGIDLMPGGLVYGAIVATARIARVVSHPRELPQEQARWWLGPLGWVLSDVRALEHPVAIAGGQKFWRLPERVAMSVREQTIGLA